MECWSRVGGCWQRGDRDGAEVRWFHLVGESAGELDALAARFGLHPLSIEDCRSTLMNAPKIDDFGDHLFIVFQAICPGVPLDEVPKLEELDAFLGRDFLITYTDRPIPEVEPVLAALAVGAAIRPGPDGLLYEVIDRVVDAILPEVDRLADALDALEVRALENPGSRSEGQAIVELRSRAGRFRRLLAAQLGVVQRLSRGEFAVIAEPNRVYFRDIYDHLVRIDLGLENVREDAEVALATYLGSLNNRLSEVMKVLSLVATLALPATVISGIFGTNFESVPGLRSNWGFATMILAMVAVSGSMALYFRRRGWF